MNLSNFDIDKLTAILNEQEARRTDEFPLFPTLSPEGHKEAQQLIESFKEKLINAAKDAISDLYCDIADYIESDSWTNYRATIMAGMKNYRNRHRQAEYDFKEIRQEIYKEFRDEIIEDLNQDLVKENEKLKEDVKYWQGLYKNRPRGY